MKLQPFRLPVNTHSLRLATLTALIVACSFGLQTLHGADDIVAPGAEVKLLADGFKFTEGPAVDAKGNVLFTDQPNDRIMKWDVDGKLSTFMQPCGRANGLYFDSDGNLWACADEKNELWCSDGLHLSPEGYTRLGKDLAPIVEKILEKCS